MASDFKTIGKKTPRRSARRHNPDNESHLPDDGEPTPDGGHPTPDDGEPTPNDGHPTPGDENGEFGIENQPTTSVATGSWAYLDRMVETLEPVPRATINNIRRRRTGHGRFDGHVLRALRRYKSHRHGGCGCGRVSSGSGTTAAAASAGGGPPVPPVFARCSSNADDGTTPPSQLWWPHAPVHRPLRPKRPAKWWILQALWRRLQPHAMRPYGPSPLRQAWVVPRRPVLTPTPQQQSSGGGNNGKAESE